MITFNIKDRNKKFKFNSKLYSTPCRIDVNPAQLNLLHEILKNNNISDVIVYSNLKKQNKSKIKKMPILSGEGGLSLSYSIK